MKVNPKLNSKLISIYETNPKLINQYIKLNPKELQRWKTTHLERVWVRESILRLEELGRCKMRTNLKREFVFVCERNLESAEEKKKIWERQRESWVCM